MSSAPSLWNAFGVMIGLVLLSAVTWLIAVEMEKVNQTFANVGIYNLPEEWQQANMVNWAVNLLYTLVYIFPIAGVAHFIIAVVRKQRYDTYQQQYNYY